MIKLGSVFTNWTVIGIGRNKYYIDKSKTNPTKRRTWLCTCKCGKIKQVMEYSLIKQKSKSCGCLQAILASVAISKHGDYKAPEYKAWQAMKSRCLNPNDARYDRYGGRNIKVCDEWLNYENFINDMGRRPSKDYSLERKDNNLGYSKANCKWATRTEQMANLHTTVKLEYKGESVPVSVLAKCHGIRSNVILLRLKAGWDIEKILTTPVRKKKSNHTE